MAMVAVIISGKLEYNTSYRPKKMKLNWGGIACVRAGSRLSIGAHESNKIRDLFYVRVCISVTANWY